MALSARRQAPAAHGDPAQLTAHSKAVNPMRRHEDKSGTYNWHIGAQTHALPGQTRHRSYSAGTCLALRALLRSVSDLSPGLPFAWLGLKPGG